MDENARTGELRRKLEKDPGSRLFAQLAEELRKEGKHDEAISVARKGLEKNANYPSARLTLARALLDSGRPAEARPELETIVKASPDNIMASRLLGDALGELGETAQALQQFEKTLRISPGDKAVLERMAEMKARLASATAPPPASEPEPATPDAPFPPVATDGALPSVFAEAPARPPVEVAEVPALLPASVPTPAQGPAAVALDRDLASGTLSPGSLNAADLQRHFEAAAASTEDPTTISLPAPPVVPEFPPTVAGSVSLPVVETAPAAEALPSVEMPASDEVGATTLPLSSVTLADLYLQQGLKAEASAVLSQVLKEEPQNAQARSKLDVVSGELAQVAPEPAPAAPRTPAEVREQTILSLKAFASAVEREAVHQKATEQGAF